MCASAAPPRLAPASRRRRAERRTEDRSLVADWGFALQKKADAYTGRGAQTPDVVF
jgi:hypothetical protein